MKRKIHATAGNGKLIRKRGKPGMGTGRFTVFGKLVLKRSYSGTIKRSRIGALSRTQEQEYLSTRGLSLGNAGFAMA